MRSITLPIRHTLIIATSLTVAASTAVAQDSAGYYAKLFVGTSSLQDDALTLNGDSASVSFDPGAAFGGAIGYDYANRPFRAEVEYAYRTGDATGLPAAIGTGGDFASTSLMLNGYYMFTTASNLKPYVGLGLGFATEIDFDIEGGPAAGEYSESGSLAYQAVLGVEYPASNRVSLYGEVRYFSAGSVDLQRSGGGSLTSDYDTLDFNIGLAVKF